MHTHIPAHICASVHTHNGQNNAEYIVGWQGELVSNYAMGVLSGSLAYRVFIQVMHQGFLCLSVWQLLQGGGSTVAGAMRNPHTFVSTSERGWSNRNTCWLWWEDTGQVGVGISELAWSVLWFECIFPYSNSCWGLFPLCGSVGRWNLVGGIWTIRVESSWMHARHLPQVSLLLWDWDSNHRVACYKGYKDPLSCFVSLHGLFAICFPTMHTAAQGPTKSRAEATGTLLLDSSPPPPKKISLLCKLSSLNYWV